MVMNVRQRTTLVLFQYFIEHKSIFKFVLFIVKLRQGSGKERQGKARKGKDGER